MNFFGVGLPEMMLIFVVALIVFGPKKLPEIGRTLAKTLKTLQDASKEFESQLNQEAAELQQSTREVLTPAESSIESQSETDQISTETSEIPVEIPVTAEVEVEVKSDSDESAETVAPVLIGAADPDTSLSDPTDLSEKPLEQEVESKDLQSADAA